MRKRNHYLEPEHFLELEEALDEFLEIKSKELFGFGHSSNEKNNHITQKFREEMRDYIVNEYFEDLM